MRKSAVVEVPAFPGTQNRDIGKRFLITEWSASQAEKWGIRAFLALNRSGGSIPMEMRGIGMEGLTLIGINTFLRGNIQSDEIIPLLDELLTCVQVLRDKKHPDVATPLMEEDLQEVATRLWLRSEVLSLHTNFSITGALTALWKRVQTMTPSQDLPTP